MGFRIRRRINLGGGFKVNLSKSGIGYSWGTNGFRVTKKCRGGTRTTTSIPGTGLSYVKETKKKTNPVSNSNSEDVRHSQPEQHKTHVAQTYDTQTIENSTANLMISEGLEDMISLAAKIIKFYKLIWLSFWISLFLGCICQPVWLLSAVLLIYAIYYKKNKAIDLNYTIDDDFRNVINERMSPLIKITQCNKVWRITQTSKVDDKKYSSGASNLIKRTECKTSTTATFPFRTNEQVALFKTEKETLLFLPDKLLIIQGAKIGALSYDDIKFSLSATRFIETEEVPKDSNVIDYTWEYLNKSGGPDKRFQNNRKLPICKYGEMELKSDYGLNTIIMFSKYFE